MYQFISRRISATRHPRQSGAAVWIISFCTVKSRPRASSKACVHSLLNIKNRSIVYIPVHADSTDSQKPCSCAPALVTKYQKRISGPLLDRIDIHIEVSRVDYEKLSGDRMGELPSVSVQECKPPGTFNKLDLPIANLPTPNPLLSSATPICVWERSSSSAK
jgi:magnesium chelatase subunit ChlI-like protein